MAINDDIQLVTGAGGFIGGHLVGRLLAEGKRVRAVDQKSLDQWYQLHQDAENLVLDLRKAESCQEAARGTRWIYHLASDMGGMGFIESHKAECMISVLIDAHMLLAARDQGCERFFYASTACVYPESRQDHTDVNPLREDQVYPAQPEDGYGWEKLYAERLCRHFREDYGLSSRIARYHAVFGEQGTFDGGREKAPAALCRKIALAKLTGTKTLDIWGDGKQTRSFLYIDEAIEGTRRIMEGEVSSPFNLGSDNLVTINQLADLIEEIAGVQLERHYNLSAPQGVRGRCSDNTLIHQSLDWSPSLPLRHGIERTYRWIHDQVAASLIR